MSEPSSSRDYLAAPPDLAATLALYFRVPSATAFPPLDSPFTDRLLGCIAPDHPLRDHAVRFARDGYTVLDLGLADAAALAERIVRDLAPRYPAAPRRIFDAWMQQDDVRALAANERVLELLRFLYQREPIPFQTLNFDRGTGYSSHSDMVHFYSFPHRFMACVWVALEDVDGDNGPIFCWAGSHRLPDYSLNDAGLVRGFDEWARFEHFSEALAHASGLERREVHLRRGQALIWAANMLHGGTPVRDPRRSRHSQVSHYFFADCTWWIPGGSDLLLGKPCLREVIDVRRGCFVTPRYHGANVDLAAFERVWRYPRPLPEWVVAATG